MATAGIVVSNETNDPTRSIASSDLGDLERQGCGRFIVGDTIGRYQLRRLLGEGGMGQVYLARDLALGRSVALKFIAGTHRTERSLDEARAIARLNHPNIVQLYDYGEYDNGLYLALEYVEGDTLERRMSSGQTGLVVDDALRHARAIADALAHAHASEVYHCDLKPNNIMVGRDGRIRVVDFGIARTGATRGGIISGTPDWMAPEQWLGLPVTDRVDSWALGIVTAQLLTGRHPLGVDSSTRRAAARDPGRTASFSCDGVPATIVELVVRSLDRLPELRPSMVEWRSGLDEVITGRSDLSAEDGPYPGLLAFDEQRARFYFGREAEIDEFVERLREVPCLPIIGPSGSGKSSLLHAGVIPRLRAREPWTVVTFRPGSDPVRALARHLIVAIGSLSDREEPERVLIKDQSSSLYAELIATPTLLAARLATIATTLQTRVLLAVDQLEEVFTQCSSEIDRTLFLRMILTAVDDPLDPVRLVFTVRDDFLGKISGLRSLFVVQKLALAQLRSTITGPLIRYRYEVDDVTMIDDLIKEVGSAEVADLPLLQFACRTLWDGRDRSARRLLRSTYVEMGGLVGALGKHAEHALAELSAQERHTARRILLQLVAGTTRRTVLREPLLAALGVGAESVLDRLLAARLLVQRRQSDAEDSSVEIAHESLLQTWPQLARWVDESRDERRLLDELEDATSRWERRGRRTEDTWSSDDLATARHRAARLGLALPARIQAFFAVGDARHRRQRRRRRVRYGLALASIAAMAFPVFLLIARYLSREQLIRVNAGTVDLALTAYDWIDDAPHPVSMALLPELTWRLYGAKPGDPDEPGEPLPPQLVQQVRSVRDGARRIDRITAPGGTAFLEIRGRGVAGELCSASWIRMRAFPGYASARRRAIERFAIEIPTCQATRANAVPIEAGPFIYGGPGDPPSKMYGDPDYTQPEQRIDLPAFFMDRTEVSNAIFAPFARMAYVTGYSVPIYSNDVFHAHDGDPESPVTEINAFEAKAFCQYLGKRLPSDAEWVKSARGGLVVHGERNPYPRRLYPWGTEPKPDCVNQDGIKDGFAWVAPVQAFPCGASPYGLLNLAGNVQEWISRDGQFEIKSPLHSMRGGGADSPANLDHTTTLFINHQNPRNFNYSLGFRCAYNQ